MKRRTEAEWLELTKEYYASGLTQTQWCQKHNIKVNTFRKWLCRMRKAESPLNSKNSGKKDINLSNIKKKSKKQDIEWIEYKPNYEIIAAESELKEIQIGIGHFTVSIKSNFHEEAFHKVCKVLMQL